MYFRNLPSIAIGVVVMISSASITGSASAASSTAICSVGSADGAAVLVVTPAIATLSLATASTTDVAVVGITVTLGGIVVTGLTWFAGGGAGAGEGLGGFGIFDLGGVGACVSNRSKVIGILIV